MAETDIAQEVPMVEDDPDALIVLSKSERRRRARLKALPTWGETAEQTRARRTRQIKQWALEAGFSRVGIAPAAALVPELGRLQAWLAAGMHGTMDYMAEAPERRADPGQLVPGARSVVALALDYDTAHPRTRQVALEAEDRAWISRYAWGTDYHVVAEKRLKALTERVTAALKPELAEDFRGPGVPAGPFKAVKDFRWYVDHGPVLERTWAVRAGLGWQGKHSLVIHPRHGSYFFLAVIVTSLDLETDSTVADHCGTCTACLDACPTGAIVQPYVVDARKCLSHATIEVPGPVPVEMRNQLGDMLFGCDLCQDVCPWNRFSQPCGDPSFEPRPGNLAPTLAELEALDEATFAERFGQSAVKRRGLEGLQDNLRALRHGRLAWAADGNGHQQQAQPGEQDRG